MTQPVLNDSEFEEKHRADIIVQSMVEKFDLDIVLLSIKQSENFIF